MRLEPFLDLKPIFPDLPDAVIETPLPVLNYSTGAGWHSWGQAKSIEGARRIIKENLPSSASALLNKGYGFKLTVTRRTALQRELMGGPDGFIWNVRK